MSSPLLFADGFARQIIQFFLVQFALGMPGMGRGVLAKRLSKAVGGRTSGLHQDRDGDLAKLGVGPVHIRGLFVFHAVVTLAFRMEKGAAGDRGLRGRGKEIFTCK